MIERVHKFYRSKTSVESMMKSSVPYFSIVMPTFNRAHIIAKAIKSVLAQSFRSWELIIIDDESIDATDEVVRSFTDQRVRYIKQRHAERSTARNRGIVESVGTYVMFLDDDEYYLNSHLQSFFDRIQQDHAPIAAYFSDYSEEIDGQVHEMRTVLKPSRNAVEFVLLNLINTSRICVSRQILDEVKFNPFLRVGEDRDFLAQICAQYPLYHLSVCSQILVVHRQRSVSLENYANYFENLSSCQYLVKAFGSYLSDDSKRRIIAQSYNNMMLHHLVKRRGLKALYWLTRTLLCHRGYPRCCDLAYWREYLHPSAPAVLMPTEIDR